MWQTVGDEHRALPQLPAHRRRDRRQGLHRRAPVRRREAAGDRHRPRRLRVPGPEVLGRVARSSSRPTSGRRCASGWRPRSRRSRMGDVADFRTSWAPSSTPARSPPRSERSRRPRRGSGRDRRRRRVRRQRGLVRPADRDRDRRTRLPHDAGGALRARRHRLRLRRRS